MEYTAAHGHSFGPVRMMGTIGYQLGILATGFLLVGSLRRLYPAMGLMLLLAAGTALLLPGVRGHQHAREKVSPAAFLQSRDLLLLLAVVFLASIGHQFNLTFFSKHLGDLGLDNAVTGIITMLSVTLEIPFLMFGDRLMKRLSIWRWMTLGLLIGAVRFALLSVVRSPAAIVLAQSLSIAHLSCFEFFPMVYLSRTVRKELLASSQSVLQMTSFGIARIVGSLAGGLVADATGIPAVYGICGAVMLAAAALFYIPMRTRALAERR
jgi:PPP family 3-phenylpropionic acid transporter